MLFSLRRNPANYDFVRGLNQIDVVFGDTPTVLTAWHTHFRDLHDENLTDSDTIWNVGRVRLLSAMAVALGYGSLNQTDILQHYTPQSHGHKEKFDFDLQFAALKFFETGKIVYEVMLDNTPGYREKEGQAQSEQPKEPPQS